MFVSIFRSLQLWSTNFDCELPSSKQKKQQNALAPQTRFEFRNLTIHSAIDHKTTIYSTPDNFMTKFAEIYGIEHFHLERVLHFESKFVERRGRESNAPLAL